MHGGGSDNKSILTRRPQGRKGKGGERARTEGGGGIKTRFKGKIRGGNQIHQIAKKIKDIIYSHIMVSCTD